MIKTRVIILPTKILPNGPNGVDCVCPDFGSLQSTFENREWGQASSDWEKNGQMAIWVKCTDEELTTLLENGNSIHLGNARVSDENVKDDFNHSYSEVVSQYKESIK